MSLYGKEQTMKRKILAGILIIAGIAIMAVPFYWRFQGNQETDRIITEFEQELEETGDEEAENRTEDDEQAALSEEDAALLAEGDVIGIITIEKIGIRYPIMEGTGSKVLNAGIGHLPETAQIGEVGNTVLCGHNGSRYGTFFTPLNQVVKGDEVSILDKNGEIHLYEVSETFIIDPYDNSIKTQSDKEELTLFTCANKGSMRFVAKCVPKVEGEADGE